MCLHNANLIDLGFSGQRFTWSNKRTTHNKLILECLNKFYANENWLHLFPDSNVLRLPHIHFDYCPLLLNLHKATTRPLPTFKFETMWLNNYEFQSVVAAHQHHNSTYSQAINVFTGHVHHWNKHTFGIFSRKRKSLFLAYMVYKNGSL